MEEIRKPNYLLFCIGISILMIGTVIFRVDDGSYDIAITEAFYNRTLPIGERFFLAKLQPWDWFKRNDHTFTIVLLTPLITMVLVGSFNRKYRPMVRYALFGISSIAIGPGLLVNVLFKGYWGRPRPSQTCLWPNSDTADNLPFYKVWEPAFLDGMDDAAFPCGHASIVIVYIILYYIFINPETAAYLMGGYKDWKVKVFTFLKYFGLFTAFVGGFLMGLTRIVQGAHHASDVLWSFGMVFLINWIFYYYVFKIPQWENKELKKLEGRIHSTTFE